LETRTKIMRQQILSSAVKLEDSSEEESYYVKEDLFDFPEETEEDPKTINLRAKKSKAQHLILDRKKLPIIREVFSTKIYASELCVEFQW